MTIGEIERVLTAHYIPVMITDGRIYGLESFTEADGRPGAIWRNMTTWSRPRLRAWLGY